MNEETCGYKKKLVPGIIITVVVIFIITIIIIARSNGSEREARQHMELAERYLSELEYEKAIAEYKVVIGIDPMCVEAYLHMADTYLLLSKDMVSEGDIEGAIRVLEEAREIIKKGCDSIQNEDIRNRWNEINQFMESLKEIEDNTETENMSEESENEMSEEDGEIKYNPVENRDDYISFDDLPDKKQELISAISEALLSMHGQYEVLINACNNDVYDEWFNIYTTYHGYKVSVNNSITITNSEGTVFPIKSLSFEMRPQNGEGYEVHYFFQEGRLWYKTGSEYEEGSITRCEWGRCNCEEWIYEGDAECNKVYITDVKRVGGVRSDGESWSSDGYYSEETECSKGEILHGEKDGEWVSEWKIEGQFNREETKTEQYEAGANPDSMESIVQFYYCGDEQTKYDHIFW